MHCHSVMGYALSWACKACQQYGGLGAYPPEITLFEIQSDGIFSNEFTSALCAINIFNIAR